MPSISVRKIDENTIKQLRSRASKHGVSMEEEVRQILKRAVATPENLGDLAIGLFSPAYGGDPIILPERDRDSPPEFT